MRNDNQPTGTGISGNRTGQRTAGHVNVRTDAVDGAFNASVHHALSPYPPDATSRLVRQSRQDSSHDQRAD